MIDQFMHLAIYHAIQEKSSQNMKSQNYSRIIEVANTVANKLAKRRGSHGDTTAASPGKNS